MAEDDVIVRLARQIDAARKSERFLVNAAEVAGLRRVAACRLHQICLELVSSLNRELSHSAVDLSPPSFAPDLFRESGVNIFQIGSQGRQMQITFQATAQLFSTDKFLIPYVLEGEVRTYNQRMLEHFDIRSRLLFFCLEEDSAVWRLFDLRGPRSALVDRDLLASLMEPLF
jgi:hypothetical protein